MAKNKLLATEPAGDAALLNGQPVKEKHESIWKDVFAGIVSNKASLVSGIFILILAAIAIVTKLAPGILPYDPYAQNLGESLLGPSAQHWFGTDIQGRDIFCRVLVGTQITLTVGLAAVAISLTVGVILGSIAGYKGGKWDTVIMRIMDMMLAIPSILLAIAIMAALGPGIEKAVVAIGLVAIPEYARIVRSEILSIKEGQTVTITADAISDRTFTGVVTSVSAAGTTTGGTTTYPVTIRIDDTGDLLPGMNATAEIEVSSASNALAVPNGSVVRGNYVLVTKDSPSAANAVQDMTAPDGYVYVKITTGTSDNDSIEVTGGLQEGDTIAYDANAAEKQNASDSMEFMVGPGGSGGPGRGDGGPGGGGPGGGF